LLTFWPAEYRQWARMQGLQDGFGTADDHRPGEQTAQRREGPDVEDPPHTHQREDDSGQNRRRATTFAIVSPPSGATYLIDPTLRREFQTVPLRAVAAHGRIEWTVAGRAVGAAAEGQAIEWALVPGQHRIVARDADGRTAEATITVR
jgi:membrane carboxypeptidase/penicillin-binding protein PbpC